MNKVNVIGLFTILIGVAFFAPIEDALAQTNMFKNSNSDRLRRERERSVFRDKERKLRQALKAKEQELKEKEALLNEETLAKSAEAKVATEEAIEKKAYDALVRRDIAGTVLARSPDWLIIEDESGAILCFAVERLKGNKSKTALVGKVLSTQKGDHVQLTTFTDKQPIVSVLRPIKKRK